MPGIFHRHSSLMGYSPCMGLKIVGLNTHAHMYKKPSVKQKDGDGVGVGEVYNKHLAL